MFWGQIDKFGTKFLTRASCFPSRSSFCERSMINKSEQCHKKQIKSAFLVSVSSIILFFHFCLFFLFLCFFLLSARPLHRKHVLTESTTPICFNILSALVFFLPLIFIFSLQLLVEVKSFVYYQPAYLVLYFKEIVAEFCASSVKISDSFDIFPIK